MYIGAFVLTLAFDAVGAEEKMWDQVKDQEFVSDTLIEDEAIDAPPKAP